MKSKLITGLLIVGIFFAPSRIYADANGSKREDIKRLLILTGSGKMGERVLDQVISSFKARRLEAPKEYWEETKKEFNPEDLLDSVVSIYEKYLTYREIKELLRFYSSPVGKKLIKVQPHIVQETMEAGQVWGVIIGKKILHKLKRRRKFSDQEGKFNTP